MILRFERGEYWDWIEFSLHSLEHPLQERFKGPDPHRVLVSREELDLIIEAVTECRTDWEWNLDQGDEDLTERDKEGLCHDIEMLDETIDFLKESLVTP
jgi:virulence-associated protein VagC